MDNKWAVAFVALLVAAIVGGIAGLSRIASLQDDLSAANDEVEETNEETDDLADELDSAESENEKLRRRLRQLRQEQETVAANDFGISGLVLELADNWICYQWPRCWDIEVDGTVVNNTDDGGVIECLVAMEYENGDVIRESVWSDYVPAHEETPVTFFHYQENFGPDIDGTYSEGCRWGDGPRDI